MTIRELREHLFDLENQDAEITVDALAAILAPAKKSINCYLSRKACDLDELIAQPFRSSCKTVIEKEVVLDLDAWFDWTKDLMANTTFIAENKANMWHHNGVWHCILVRCADRTDGILVESEGYDYARYACYMANV